MPATLCVICGQPNMHGAFICSACGMLLETTVRVKPITDNLRNKTGETYGKKPEHHTAHEGRLTNPHSVALYIQDSEDPQVIFIARELVIGRSTPTETEMLRFDLSAYNAQEYGVSRRHAILKRTPIGIVLEDMGSSNGTWVNGTLVAPYSPVPIQSGDQIRLGKLEIEIYLP